MCSVDAPEPQVIEAPSPTFARNPYLDEVDNDVAAANAMRRGRSSLVIPGNTQGIGFEGRTASGARGATGLPNGNSRGPGGSGMTGRRLGIPAGSPAGTEGRRGGGGGQGRRGGGRRTRLGR